MSTSAQPNTKILEEMLNAACHFGHRVSKWNPKMHRYLYTKREGIHIFDLTETYKCLIKALDFLKETASQGKIILIVSTKLHTARLMDEATKKTACPFVSRKWIPGLLTNFDTLRKRINYFKELKEKKAAGDWEKYTKKERLELQRTLDKLEDAFSGVQNMNKLPDVVVVLNAVHDALVLREAKRLKITTVAICDSNADPDLVTYPIPGNDDAIKSLSYFIEKITTAIEEGKKNPVVKTPPQNKPVEETIVAGVSQSVSPVI